MIRNFALPRSLPTFGKVVLNALQFSGQCVDGISLLSIDEWKKLLVFCDNAQLTFTFSYLCRSELPDWVRSRIDVNYQDAIGRLRRVESALKEIADRFTHTEIDFVLLKGCAHSTEFGPDVSLRATSDLDLWCRAEEIGQAHDELVRLGYCSIGKGNGRHLASMIREKEWRWCGNFYAPDLPLPVELHYKLWDDDMEGIQGPPEPDFWRRRSYLDFDGAKLSVLALPDALAFSALHLLMHIFHGDLRLQRAWEIAYFLHRRFEDDVFWREWMNLHSPELRKLEILVFLLVQRWFGCNLPEVVRSEAKGLAFDVKLWIELHGFSPVEALFNSNKAELWLNLSLVPSFRGKVHVLLRRILPIHGSRTVRLGDSGTQRGILSRARHHIQSFGPTLTQGIEWWRMQNAHNRPRRQPRAGYGDDSDGF